MELCSLAGGGWDERYVLKHLAKQGWKIDGKVTTCEQCNEPEEE